MNTKASNPGGEPEIVEPPIDVEDLRPHVFDGIQEYDKRLPNWWLWTFYGAIIFSVGYWIVVHVFGVGENPGVLLTERLELARIEAKKKSGEITNESLWALSRDPIKVTAGRTVFGTTCASCHRADLKGQIGPNLVDNEWVHGAEPLVIFKTIAEGVPAKGMPGWQQILGEDRVVELTAFILSHHSEGEPVEIKPWVPTTGAPTTATTAQ
jgi:cytochrome c oxidase cbb3-type subunit 3